MVAPRQRSLFTTATDERYPPIDRNHYHVQHSTFLGGLGARVHRWFRLTPSFGPELVRKILDDTDTPPGSVVLDPFAGAGTTLIEAKLAGHRVIGNELNPFLHFVCETSLNWTLDPPPPETRPAYHPESFPGGTTAPLAHALVESSRDRPTTDSQPVSLVERRRTSRSHGAPVRYRLSLDHARTSALLQTSSSWSSRTRSDKRYPWSSAATLHQPRRMMK